MKLLTNGSFLTILISGSILSFVALDIYDIFDLIDANISIGGVSSTSLSLIFSSIGLCAGASSLLYSQFWREQKSFQQDARPSRLGRKLLIFFLPKKQRDSLLGDLEEEFATFILPELGPRWAKVWYWKQVIRSILATNKWIGWLIGAGGLGGVAMSVGAMLKQRFYDDL